MPRVAVLAVAMGVASCGSDRDTPAPAPTSSPTPASEPEPDGPVTMLGSELSIDALRAPRDGNALIAGETVRIGMRIRGGTPPYSVHVKAARQGAPSAPYRGTPLDATLELDPHETRPNAPDVGPDVGPDVVLDVASRATLDARAASGVYQLVATIQDAAGQRATTRSPDWQLLGDDAAVIEPAEPAIEPAGPARPATRFVHILDVAGRRRASFVRGETVTVHVHVPGERLVTLALRAPNGQVLAETRLSLDDHGDARFPLDIPRLAAAGAHTVSVNSARGHKVGAVLEVAGPAWPPVQRLLVEAMYIHGGDDQRALKTNLLRRGEPLTVVARVAGGRSAITLNVQLSGKHGMVTESRLASARIERASPTSRVHVQGAWRVPEDIPAGRYQLQIEATEGEHVSLRTRDVLVE